MSKILFCSLISWKLWAVGMSNGYIAKPQGKVTVQEQKAILKTLDASECIYGNLGDGLGITEWQPEIFDAPDPCTSNDARAPKQKPLCVGTVVCHSGLLNFVVEKATCWSSDGNSCPPPSKCAQQSFVQSFEMIKASSQMPVYSTSHPAGTSK